MTTVAGRQPTPADAPAPGGQGKAGSGEGEPDRQAATTAPRAHAPLPSGAETTVRAAATDPPTPPQPAPVSHGAPPFEAPPALPVAARDVERLLRLGQLQPVPRQDGGEMRLHVASEGLGQVEVRVVVNADAVQATLTAHQDHARQMLEANRPSLEAALGRANLRLEGFTVGLGQHQQGHEGERNDGRRLSAGAAAAPVAAVAAASSPEPAMAASGLSVRA